MRKHVRTTFIVLLLLLLLAGFCRTILFPKDINTYENRYAEKAQRLTAQSFASGDFQDSLDSALADQIPKSEALKRAYNNLRSAFMKAFLPMLTSSRDTTPEEANPNNYDYVALDESITRLFGPEHLCIMPRELTDEVKAQIESHCENTNAVIARHPEIEFYAYYVEKDVDLDLRTGEKVGTPEYVFDHLNIQSANKAKFVISNAASFDYYFYMTDHHWNYLGSYLAYQQLYSMLAMEGPMLKPLADEAKAESVVSVANAAARAFSASSSAISGEKNSAGNMVFNLGSFGGSRSTGAYSAFRENFYAYKFDFPEFTVLQNGHPADDYGNQGKYYAGHGDNLCYSDFYGYDNGETIITKNGSQENNLLIIGDSYDNPVTKLIANHFTTVYNVDLRYYKEGIGEEFDFDSYVEKNNIKTVLIMGNRDLFITDQFLIDKTADAKEAEVR